MPSKTYSKTEDIKNRSTALERDDYRCVWCRRVLGIYSQASTPHHIFGRRRNHTAEAQITLCRQRSKPDALGRTTGCHDRFHHATLDADGEIEITKEKLIDLMRETYNIHYE